MNIFYLYIYSRDKFNKYNSLIMLCLDVSCWSTCWINAVTAFLQKYSYSERGSILGQNLIGFANIDPRLNRQAIWPILRAIWPIFQLWQNLYARKFVATTVVTVATTVAATVIYARLNGWICKKPWAKNLVKCRSFMIFLRFGLFWKKFRLTLMRFPIRSILDPP